VPVFALIYAIVRATSETRLRARNLPTDSDAYIGIPKDSDLELKQHKEEVHETSDI
jgi:hypothetical protein